MNKEMWETRCSREFESAKEERCRNHEKIETIRKLVVGNGEEGIVDTVRNHKRYFRCIWAIAIFVGSLIVAQTAIAVRTHMTEDISKKRIIQLLDKVESDIASRQ